MLVEGRVLIDEYVFRLRHQLRIPADAIVADVEEQLRDAATRVGEAEAIARFGSPDSVARRFHLQARRRSTVNVMRMLLAAGAALVVASVAVEVAHPDTVWPRRQMPLAAQWKLTFAGMFALTAGLFGVAAFWNRTRDNNAVAIQLALWATLAAIPAGAMHLLFQIERLSYSVHNKWFASLLATSAGVRIGVVGAAIVVITQSNRTFRLADGTARERLRPGRTLPRVRHA